jgi:hypothetical protein
LLPGPQAGRNSGTSAIAIIGLTLMVSPSA